MFMKESELKKVTDTLINDIINIYNRFNSDNKDITKKIEVNDKCKFDINCINPLCTHTHPLEYNLKHAYKKYIINEKKRNPKFKVNNCINNKCIKHKYNKCIFRHEDDPI